ncbi:hypothetical protein RB213_001167, partial [Colletotrichum asianum]
VACQPSAGTRPQTASIKTGRGHTAPWRLETQSREQPTCTLILIDFTERQSITIPTHRHLHQGSTPHLERLTSQAHSPQSILQSKHCPKPCFNPCSAGQTGLCRLLTALIKASHC